MTDLELLQSAAKDGNIRFVGYDEYYQDYSAYDPETDVNYQWNPLNSDGDALRLAVKLKLSIYQYTHDVEVIAFHHSATDDVHEFSIIELNDDLDIYKSTRLAIVSVTAKLGELKGN